MVWAGVLRPAAWLVCALALCTPLLAQPADATPTGVRLILGKAPELMPGASQAVEGKVVYTYDQRTPNLTSVTLTPTGVPEWLLARLEPASLSLNTSASGVSEAPVRLVLSALDGTSALRMAGFDVRVQAAANGPLDAAASATSVLARVAFTGTVRADAPAELRAQPGEPLEVPVRLANDANGPARVSLEALGAPAGMQVTTPGALILEAGQARNVTLGVLPGGPARVTLTLRWTAAHAFDAKETLAGGSVAVMLDVEKQGAPGPAVGLVLVAAGLVATGLGRRRKA